MPGGEDRKRLRVLVAVVLEAVDDAAPDAHRFPGTDVDRCAVDRPGEHADDSVDRLLVAVVAVRERHSGACGHIELEDRDRPSGVRALDEEPARQLPALISSRMPVAIVASSFCVFRAVSGAG
jgi:hypothetical protein